MKRRINTVVGIITALALAAVAHARVDFETTRISSPSDPSFDTVTIRMTSAEGHWIVGWDGEISSDSGISQQYPFGTTPTVFTDDNHLFTYDPAVFLDLDSQYLFETTAKDAVNGVNVEVAYEDDQQLTAAFGMEGGWNNPNAGPSVDLAQVCVPAGAAVDVYGAVRLCDAQGHPYLWGPMWPGCIEPDADGPYQIGVGDVLNLDAAGTITNSCWNVEYEWDLDGDGTFETDAGYEALLSLDYSELTALGLGPDPQNPLPIQLRVSARSDDGPFSEIASSTLTIVPEPATGALAALGALAVLRKRRG